MSISVKEVTKIYGTQKALDQVSFEIHQGEIVGFLGPNGAGKSTMMKIITCYLPPTSGNVEVCGYNISDQSIEVKKNVGYLPEHNPLYLDMYVKEYLGFVATIYKLDNKKQRIADMIEKVGLGREQHKLIGALSKGYRQRVGLAQALIHDPKVLIMDEPTTGLDPNQLEEIRRLIKTIGKEKTVMLSTHIMQEVEAICSRVIIIDKGIIVADDSVEKMHAHNQTKGYVLKVEITGDISKKNWLTLEGISQVNSHDNLWFLQTDTDKDIRERIFNFIVEQKASLLSMQKIEKTLEEVFKELTTNQN